MINQKIQELRKLKNNIQVSGDLKVFDDGPSIIMCNHNCLKDIFYLPLGLSLDDRILSLISSRLIYKQITERQDLINKYLYSMPIEAHGGPNYTNMCLSAATSLLLDNNHLNIFPEGAYIKDKQIHKGRTGAAQILFAAKEQGTCANIIPVAIKVDSEEKDLDSYNLKEEDNITIKVLEPLDYDEDYYNYLNSGNFNEKNICLHNVIDNGMKQISKVLNREYIDSYIKLDYKGNVIFENGDKIEVALANTEHYLSLYQESIKSRTRALKR